LRALHPLTPEQSLASGLLLLFRSPDGDLWGHLVSPANAQLLLLLQKTSANGQRERSLLLFCASKIAGETFFPEVRWFMCPLEAVH